MYANMLLIAHAHRRILLRAIIDQPNVPITYATPGKLDMIYGKLNGFLESGNIQLDQSQREVLDKAKVFLEDPVNKSFDTAKWAALVGKKKVNALLRNVHILTLSVDQLLSKLPTDQLFPLLDIYKSLLVHKQVSDYYVSNRK